MPSVWSGKLAAAVDAGLADGVLTVRVPKPEQAPQRHVEVRAGEA